MPYKNPAVAKEKKHEYYIRNKERIMSKVAEYKKERPEMVKTINRKYNQKKNAPYHTVLANAGIDRVCEECGSAEYVCTHHKDHNRSNNSLDNLQWLCVRCHGKLHRREQLSVPPSLPPVAVLRDENMGQVLVPHPEDEANGSQRRASEGVHNDHSS